MLNYMFSELNGLYSLYYINIWIITEQKVM